MRFLWIHPIKVGSWMPQGLSLSYRASLSGHAPV